MMTSTRALIIDDEPDIRELLEITLGRMGIETESAENVYQACQLIEAQTFDICLTDLKLPDGDGLQIVDFIQNKAPETPVAVITAHGSMDTAILAMKAGAFDFVSKPVNLDRLRTLINAALKISQESPAASQPPTSALVGNAESMMRLRSQVEKLARSQAPVYISGESGSGKELVARAIHYQGPRASGPFIPVNCGAIPRELMESEFFGHKKGSFTGAHTEKQGLFHAANDGTLFLDEVADLPLDMQVKLLRAIQEKAVRPVGAENEVPIDVRILSATHKDLQAEVEAGRFRSDLFYRINVIEVQVPPLRERIEDVHNLSELFLKRFSEESQTDTPALAFDAVQALQDYTFPGNVRELENILERAYTLCENNQITQTDLQLSHTQNNQSIAPQLKTGEMSDFSSLDEYLEEIEKNLITGILERNRWNRTATAKELGISFRSLRYRLKKLGLEDQ